jgi:hypothetical protein
MSGLKVRLIIIGIVLVIALLVGAFFGIRHMMRDSELSKFKSIAQGYASVPAEPDGGQPRVVGKVLPVNMGDRTPDHIYFDLPDDLRAAKPEEVGTVVLLSWGKIKVGDYEGGGDANQQTKRVLVSQQFMGGPPPNTTSSSGGATGSSPAPQIVTYLRGLPRGGQ